MAIKRKTREEETETETELDRKKKTPRIDDRLDSLPESLQLHILSFLDVKQAVQTSALSRTWVQLWTSMPVLNFNYPSFNKLPTFDKFVSNVLSSRDQSAKLKRLTFNRRGVSSAKILKKVLGYAVLHGVEELEVSIDSSRNDTWPVPDSPCSSSGSLRILKLQSQSDVGCSFLDPRLGLFKNLSVLHLQRAYITTAVPFSGFPLLEKLSLQHCCFRGDFKYCELTTRKLRVFEYQGSVFPRFQAHDGLPVLDTIVIGFTGHVCYHNLTEKKRIFDDLVILLRLLNNAKSVTLFSSIVDLLSLFPERLLKPDSPCFRNVKCLDLGLSYDQYRNIFPKPRRCSITSFKIPSAVKDYLVHKSPEAKVRMIYPKNFKCTTSSKI